MNQITIVLLGLSLGVGVGNIIVSFVILHFVLKQIAGITVEKRKKYDWEIGD